MTKPRSWRREIRSAGPGPPPERAVTAAGGVSRRTATPVTPVSRSASASRCTDRRVPEECGAADAAGDERSDTVIASTTAGNRKRRKIMTRG